MKPRSSQLVLVAVLLACGIGALLWWWGGERAGGTEAPARGELVPDFAGADLVGASNASQAERTSPAHAEPEAASAVAAPSEAATPVATAPRATGDVVLSGLALRVSANGVEHGADDGRFRLVQRLGAENVESQLEVVGGRWTTSVAPDASLYFTRVQLGGVPVTLEADDFAVPPEGFLTLRGIERVPVLLHVLSAATGEPLTGVEVWPGSAGGRGEDHPGVELEGDVLARGDSPLRVPPDPDAWRAGARVYVRAPGHAFGSLDLDHGVGGERTLRLAGASTLEIQLLDGAAWLEPRVRLRRPNAPTAWSASAEREPDALGRALFEALAPGE